MSSIPFRETNYFSSLICDYLEEHTDLKPFYNRYPNLDDFAAQIEEKRHSELVSESHRTVLVEVLQKQYEDISTSEVTTKNIELLQQQNTFTITTGHQLNLFTGPLYFLYKIISTINLCEELSIKYPAQNFIPIYWMATEDHDFEEINYFNFKEDKIQWNRGFGGAVGELSTEGLEEVFALFSRKLGPGKNAAYLRSLFEKAYVKHSNLADATRFLANELFGKYGLVVLDANDSDLKQLFAPYIKQELLQQTSFKAVSETIEKFPSDYKVQVNPREINLFYITKGVRERIVYENGLYKVNNTDISWTKEGILDHLQEASGCFSPNVLLRPLYQEVVLPNLCYIGGGGELAYWFEMKAMFEAFDVVFPMLLLRNSALVITEAQQKKLSKLNFSISELFFKQTDLLAKKTKELSELHIDFSTQKEFLKEQFASLYDLAKQTDKSFIGAVAAQEKKQLKGLANLEKRLLKAEKRKLKEKLNSFSALQDELFPSQSLQERNTNFSELYLEYGDGLIPMLKKELKPLDGDFTIVSRHFE
ncbi:MAG: bacillithiol biosynthesis cysteine-adding enzyme BshC [Flavobacteriaceae bacterium]|nr:bacillithiol biosynthesis cysteine-adding enzyme BshC [Flavobacteriaceae bacterium]